MSPIPTPAGEPSDRSLRVFIASPGDVGAERDAVRRVLARLARDFRYQFAIEDPIDWQRLPLNAAGHVQSQIPRPRDSDVTVVILWSRLGTPLPHDRFPGSITGRDVTGTEWEFEDALAGHRERGVPRVLLYRKRGATLERQDDEPPEATAERERQLGLVAEFFRRWSSDGSVDLAYREFRDVASFEPMIETHLRKVLEERLAPGATANRWHEGSPWRGLLAFEPRHAPIFFGRDAALRALRERLERRLAAGCPVVVVLGASGSGKSSLVKAGLVPQFELGSFVGRVGRGRAVITAPSDVEGRPVLGLSRALLTADGARDVVESGLGDADALERALRESPATAARALVEPLRREAKTRPLPADQRAGLLIVVDQLEELFAPSVPQAERETFVRSLATLASESTKSPAQDDAPPVLVVATMRSDFFDRIAMLPELASLVEGDGQLLLLPPDASEIEEILRLPAAAAGVRFERDADRGIDLAATILTAARKDTRALPLLSYVLDQLWQRRSEDGSLTRAVYDQLGGLEGAVARKAEDVLGVLPPQVQAELPAVLAELVDPESAGRRDADNGIDRAAAADHQERVRARWAPIDRFPAGSPRRALIDALLAPDVRLLVAEGDRDSMRVRVAHECLFTHWQRASECVRRDRADYGLRARIDGAYALWLGTGEREREARLLTGLGLAEAEDLLARRPDLLARKLSAFVDESTRAAQESQRRRLRKVIVVACSFAALALFAIGFGMLARTATVRAETAAFDAKIESVLARASASANSDPWRTAMILRECPSGNRHSGIASAAIQVLDQLRCVATLPGGIRSAYNQVAFSANGAKVVTASLDGTARVWDATGTGEPVVLVGDGSLLSCVAISASGTRIATGFADGTVRVWNAHGTGEPIVLRGHEGWVGCAAFNPDETRLITASVDRTARVWNADGTGETIELRGHDQFVGFAAFSPDGTRVLTASFDGTERVWNADGTGNPVVFRHGESSVLSVASFSPDGTRVVTGASDGIARVWKSNSTAYPIALRGHEGAIVSAEFSLDGLWVVTASGDRTARVWKADGTGQPTVLRGHEAAVVSAAFSPDGTRVLTASDDGTARVWNADGSGACIVLRGHRGRVQLAGFSVDGTRVLTASDDGTARVWIPQGPTKQILLKGHEGGVRWVAFSPNGRRVLTASEDNTARVWNAEGTDYIELREHDAAVSFAAFSQDGSHIVTASRDGTARVWNADGTGESVPLRGHEGTASAAFSPDGSRVLTAGDENNTAHVWNANGEGEAIPLPGHESWIESVAFSPDGMHVVTSSNDRTARVWNVDGTDKCFVLRGHEHWVVCAVFSPDGRRVLTASIDHTARVWNADGTGIPIVLRGHKDTVNAAAWNPTGTLVVTSSSDGTARVWRADGMHAPIVLQGHEAAVLSAAFSPDGERIVTSSVDGTARVWNAYGSSEPIVLEHDGPVYCAIFNPDGTRVATASDDGTARIWTIDWPTLRRKLWEAIPQRLSLEERRQLLGFEPFEIEPDLR